jgi:phosphoribosylanthranilate isomerase
MEATRLPRVKICCIASLAEARLAIDAGAHALGLVSAMPSGPGVITEETIAEVARAVPPPVATFLLTSRQRVEEVVVQHQRCRTTTIQLVDTLAEGTHADLRSALPGVGLVQVIHVTGPESVDEALAVAGAVDALLLDSGNQRLAVKELGGTGRVHDWRLSAAIREAVPIPVFLAGGLNPENVRAAIAEVGPWGLDLCGGVRTGGRLDPGKLRRFMAGTRGSTSLSS